MFKTIHTNNQTKKRYANENLSDKNDVNINNTNIHKINNNLKIDLPKIENLLKNLVEKDISLSIAYEFTSDDDWDIIQSPLDTPISSKELIEIKKQIKEFVKNFKLFRKAIKNLKITEILRLFEKHVFLYKTKLIQFIIFEVACKNHKKIFPYIFNKIYASIYKKQYIPYYCSLLVRLKISDEQKLNYLDHYYKYLTNNECVYNVQYFLYIMCFMKISKYSDISKNFFLKYSNKIDYQIATVFADIYNLKNHKNYLYRKEGESLCQFPFDEPIILEISTIYEKYYKNFDDK